MKKILLLLLLSQITFAQEKSNSNYIIKNEVKINASYLVSGGVGRNIGASDGFETVPRAGVSIGKRF